MKLITQMSSRNIPHQTVTHAVSKTIPANSPACGEQASGVPSDTTCGEFLLGLFGTCQNQREAPEFLATYVLTLLILK